MKLALAPLLVALAWPAAAPATTLLRLDGIGPLKRGMSRTAALETGWLTDRRNGCELAGPPIPIVYLLRGRKAPDRLRGTAEFRDGRLRTFAISGGAHTATGVIVGRTKITDMVARYRRAGYTASARFDRTFQQTFVRVTRGGRSVIEGAGAKNVVTVLGVPSLPVCE